MSRSSIRTFVITSKSYLSLASKGKLPPHFVTGNESADLDSITCALVYAYFKSNTPQARRTSNLWIPIVNIPFADLSLRPELTALLKYADLQPSDLVTLDDVNITPSGYTLVDHNALTGSLAERHAGGAKFEAVIDHHDDEQKMPLDARPRLIEKSGSCASLVINHWREAWESLSSSSSAVGAARGQDADSLTDDTAYTSTWDAQIAQLALGTILIDTADMTDSNKVTDHDRKAVRYLEAKVHVSLKIGKDFNRRAFYNEISAAKSDLGSLSLTDVLRKDYKQWTEGELTLGMSSVVKPIEYLESKSSAFVPDLVEFAKSRNLHIFAIMTAHAHSSDGFSRQLLVMAPEVGKAEAAAVKFARGCAEELQLTDRRTQVQANEKEAKIPWLRCWEQGNLGASRKRVGPLLREAMR